MGPLCPQDNRASAPSNTQDCLQEPRPHIFMGRDYFFTIP